MRVQLALACGALMGSWLFAFGQAHAPSTPHRTLNPLVDLRRDGSREQGPLEGRVVQRLAAGSYTYLQLQTAGAELRWVVTMGSGAAVGARVRARSLGQRRDFYSPRLQRRFDALSFAIVTRSDDH